ncbi:putative toxin-antitoxin system toxin component, PIN family [candidate division WWE3 bacterium RIFCSPHIGHO2_01_FULL_35_17]|uniref:Putative toxin-antitoxin system toxin component, PIN family n=1 Tax=candidate division WWE3 bacterium RIFCSPHIGHO2_01_FULL_35_17 TaxID=1802614 RepID=A0A1F4USS2_UNCKA|nr:MAG: putative toxin-antitoxin system toxin component, PIN family [candidate division WWE3 bacterium RIFCSPHIGHO2_01_FULL_35_17]
MISAFLWQKRLKLIYQAIRQNQLTPCFTKETWDEFLRALAYPKFKKQILKIGIAPDEITRLITSRYYFIPLTPEISVIKDDPSDNNILSAALVTKSEFIISGDRHLLSLKKFVDIPILSPQQFLKRFKKSKTQK